MSQTINDQDATSGSKIKHYLNGRWYWTPVSQLISLFQSSDDSAYVNESNTQTAVPTAGSTVQVTDASANVFLYIAPAGTLATLTIKLPTGSGSAVAVADKQEIKVFTTAAVTTLTIDANGATAVLGGPSSLAANGYFTLRYDAGTSNWLRVG